jgi:hypothetical protein
MTIVPEKTRNQSILVAANLPNQLGTVLSVVLLVLLANHAIRRRHGIDRITDIGLEVRKYGHVHR